MNKNNFFTFFKNPLWIIAILLIVMNFLLWNISQNIGHDYIKRSQGNTIKSTGLYKVIHNFKPEIPHHNDDFKNIIDRLMYIHHELERIERNTDWK